mmetsp:Transcript_1163/g.2885  ORF Transcript_1163/g.2885 Transcript_1163/m.2885 type:complete len:699 (-) Transcript_1163:89-2185(-)|eukprot:CAMPEP_0195059598 /NCGR_PEP_ID=MMETSP0448-20130528/7046_1 /TAXON_ID=66468 /ORGANISM="Heterocapsa triquestra, Strain CCMP 448" /LENGTH=698 /DNA_ID=CAMNT_0040089899 /DNA_START=88 /DNA_END=2184 /DNA_ORIENTATION=-
MAGAAASEPGGHLQQAPIVATPDVESLGGEVDEPYLWDAVHLKDRRPPTISPAQRGALVCAPRCDRVRSEPIWVQGPSNAPLQHCNILLDPRGSYGDVLQGVGSPCLEGLALFQVKVKCSSGGGTGPAETGFAIGESEVKVESLGHDRQELVPTAIGDLVIAVNGLHVPSVESYRQLTEGATSFTLTLQRELSKVDAEQAEGLWRNKLKDAKGHVEDELLSARAQTALNNLAAVLHDQHKLEEAEQLHRRVLRAREANLGLDDLTTLTSRNNLAVCLTAQGKHLQAEAQLRKCLEGFTAVLGDRHPDTVTCMHNLACVMDRQGDREEAEPLLSYVMGWRTVALGPSHAATLASMTNLACLYEVMGRLRDAEKLCRKTLKEYTAKFGEDSPDARKATNNLACLLEAQSKFCEAEKLYRQVWNGLVRDLGDSDLSCAESGHNLACVLHAQGKLDEAYPIYKRAFLAFDRELGFEHPDTLGCMYNLASLLHVCGQLDTAAVLFRKELEGMEALRGPMHEDTLRSVGVLARTVLEQGKLEEAEGLYRRVIAGWDVLHGPNNEESVRGLQSLAQLLNKRGNFLEAESCFRQAVTGWESLLADSPPSGAQEEHRYNLLLCARGFAELLRQQGREQEAEMFIAREQSRGDGGVAFSRSVVGLVSACTGREVKAQVIQTVEMTAEEHAAPGCEEADAYDEQTVLSI